MKTETIHLRSHVPIRRDSNLKFYNVSFDHDIVPADILGSPVILRDTKRGRTIKGHLHGIENRTRHKDLLPKGMKVTIGIYPE